MKKIFYISFALFFSLMLPSFAQDYKTGIGLRGGWTSGLTVKHFIKEQRAIEGILSSGYGWGKYYSGFQITGLYEIHKPAFKNDVEGFFWFYGVGAHIAGGRYEELVWIPTDPKGNDGYWKSEPHNYFAAGVDGIFGIEYKISEIPFTVGADVKPFLEFGNNNFAGFFFWDSALSIRFVF